MGIDVRRQSDRVPMVDPKKSATTVARKGADHVLVISECAKLHRAQGGIRLRKEEDQQRTVGQVLAQAEFGVRQLIADPDHDALHPGRAPSGPRLKPITAIRPSPPGSVSVSIARLAAR